MRESSGGHARADLIVAGARACVGTRFRAQGRLVGVGLDCLGVVVCAAWAAEIGLRDRRDYSLRADMSELDAALANAGLRRVARVAAGDVVLIEPITGARHLAVWTGSAAVHAHAGLGRVVEGPLDPAWRVVSGWRLPRE